VTLRNTKDDLRERARIAELAHFDAWRFGA
jgi:hypothetical protein